MKKLKYILDSYALLAYFQAEPAGAAVRNILKDGMHRQIMS
jgi:PIN domain nuclease of toxin-antitoxin system